MLVGRGEPAEEREGFDAVAEPAHDRFRGLADLPLAAEKDERVAGPFGEQLLECRQHAGLEVVLLVAVFVDRAVANLDGVGAAGDLDDGGVAEVPGEGGGIDGQVVGDAG